MSFYKNFNIKAIFAILFAATLAGAGCKKPGITSEAFQSTNLNVIYTWDSDVPVAFSLDTTVKLYNGSLSFANQTFYEVLYSGNRVAKFKNDDDGTLLYSKPINMESGKAYSLFLTGTENTPDAVYVEDDVSNPGDAKTRFRLANMNPDQGSKYDVYFQVGGGPMQKVFSAVGSKTVSAPIVRDSSTQLHIITAINPGVDTIVLGDNFTRFLPEKAYTLVIVGQKGGLNPQEIMVTDNAYRY